MTQDTRLQAIREAVRRRQEREERLRDALRASDPAEVIRCARELVEPDDQGDRPPPGQ